ncbi:MAG: hypothetical protein ACREH6_03380, partial [Geminicoccaceae bacterium]
MDGLAIGAPLTAAFVGVLVAQGEVLAGASSPAGGEDGGWAARGPAGASTSGTPPAGKMSTESIAITGAGVPPGDHGGASGVFDPTSTSEPAGP